MAKSKAKLKPEKSKRPSLRKNSMWGIDPVKYAAARKPKPERKPAPSKS